MTFDPTKHGALCHQCPRRGQPVVPPDGPSENARYVALGQDPGPKEVVQGRPFVGPTGKRFFRIWDAGCKALGKPVVPRNEILILNAACCPPKSKSPVEFRKAVTACRPLVLGYLKKVNPSAGILAMGKWALYSLTGHEKGHGNIQGFHVFFSLEDMEGYSTDEGEGGTEETSDEADSHDDIPF